MDRRFQAAVFDADELERTAARPDGRIAQFTFKDAYGNTLMIQMDDELGAHFVAQCHKVFVSRRFDRTSNETASIEERRAWPSRSLSRLTTATASVSGIPPHDAVHLQLDRGFSYELNYEVTPQLADQLAESLQEAVRQVRSRRSSQEG